MAYPARFDETAGRLKIAKIMTSTHDALTLTTLDKKMRSETKLKTITGSNSSYPKALLQSQMISDLPCEHTYRDKAKLKTKVDDKPFVKPEMSLQPGYGEAKSVHV